MFRFAINPLQWYADDKGGLTPALAPPRGELFKRVRETGFEAISTSMSAAEDIDAYEADLAAADLKPGPGYFSFDLATDDLSPLYDGLDRYARAHNTLGLTEVYLAGKNVPARIENPVIGVDADPARDAVIARNVEEVARRFLDRGVRACFHQHIGTWVETPAETYRLFDGVPDDVLFAGPDTGHLTWAGMDPVAFVSDYRDRVLTLHMKDVHHDLLATARGTYWEVILHGILTEPGRGQVDNEGVLRALPADFEGWVVMEVDRPDGVSPEESARIAAQWAALQR